MKTHADIAKLSREIGWEYRRARFLSQEYTPEMSLYTDQLDRTKEALKAANRSLRALIALRREQVKPEGLQEGEIERVEAPND